MLQQLTIQHIVLVDSLEVPFQKGFCVLTGETGAGKSILLDALGLALGSRADAKLVQQGQEKGLVVAEFDASGNTAVKALLAEHDIDAEDALILRRTLQADGKSKAYINDTPVGVGLLQQIGEQLVEVHGQHDQRGLLNAANHLKILDQYAGVEKELKATSECYKQWKAVQKEYEEIRAAVQKAQEEEEYLRHVLQELEELAPQPGEEEKLAEQRTLLQHREKILETLNTALGELEGQQPVGDALRTASRILERNMTQAGELFASAIEALDRAAEEVNTAQAEIERIGQEMDMDAASLEQIEERLFALRALSRKHHRPVDELAAYTEEVAQQLQLLKDTDSKLRALEQQLTLAREDYITAAHNLHDKRTKASGDLEKAVSAELEPLKMAGSKVQVEIESLPEDKWAVHGQDKVQFLVRTNPGSPFGPLHKIASGGELSRFMLALKVVLSELESVPTLIFDEIDTGVSGATADAVGKRLAALGECCQVLAITHLPQVAAYGTHHLRVEKQQSASKTTTLVDVLNEKTRKEEMARLLAGASVTEEARAAAGKLMSVES